MGKNLDDIAEDGFFEITPEVQRLRRTLGLPELSFQTVECRRILEVNEEKRVCGTPFKSQFLGKKRIQFYCRHCCYSIARRDTLFAL
jgi:hypothetical protein